MFKNKGTKLEHDKIKVQKLKNKQLIATIPKFIGKHLDLEKGSVLVFRIRGDNLITIKKIIDDD
jgi:hypothetical protein